MMIGKFKADEEGGYTGELNALGLTIEAMHFCPVNDKRDDGADFIVIGYGEPPDICDIDLTKYPPHEGQVIPNTNTYELGAAWKKLSAQSKPYLSVKLDGPTLRVPIQCALIEQNDGTYHLIWRRGEEEAEQGRRLSRHNESRRRR